MIITTRKTICMVTGEVLVHEFFEYTGSVDLCCGASQQQIDIQAKQAAYYDAMTQQASQIFAQATTVFKELQSAFAPIVAAGPNQHGFGDEELTALNTNATEGVGRAYSKASAALGEQLAARGGGNAFLPSGGEESLRGTLASEAAQQESQLKNSIITQDYSLGRNNFYQAASALGGATGTYNPATAMSSSATGAGSAAATTANEITQANNSWVGAVTGMAGAIGGAAVTGGFNLAAKQSPCWIAAATFNGWDDPRTSLVRNWLLDDFSRNWYGRVIVGAYGRFGERIARVPILVTLCRPFIMAALKQTGWQNGT